MKKQKIEKSDKKKTVWKTIAGVFAVVNIAFFALILLIVRGKTEKKG